MSIINELCAGNISYKGYSIESIFAGVYIKRRGFWISEIRDGARECVCVFSDFSVYRSVEKAKNYIDKNLNNENIQNALSEKTAKYNGQLSEQFYCAQKDFFRKNTPLNRETFTRIYATLVDDKLQPIIETKDNEVYNISGKCIRYMRFVNGKLNFVCSFNGIKRNIELSFDEIKFMWGGEEDK